MENKPKSKSTAKSVSRRIALRSGVGRVLPLTAMMELYGGTDKVTHGYGPSYERHFAPFRARRNVIVEIGVGGYSGASYGGSLKIWRDYFFRSTIVGVDIHEKNVNLGRRVSFVRADQSNPVDLARVLEAAGRAPDIVIDDGSHRGTDQWTTFEYFWPRMASGSLYVVEDLHTSYWGQFGGDIPAPDKSGIGLARSLVDGVQANDATFIDRPEWGPAPPTPPSSPISLAVYPGLFIATKD